MNIERIFKEDTNITLQDTLKFMVNDMIDSLISIYYSQDKVNTTTSHVERKDVA
ncbi:hypothetical protein JDW21_11490 [Bacillus subtilis]|uniref:hypothetical protein n=1 Tax=Bacillaceae TaxID=186817 RepID=UPI00132E7683|nr:MULTISPECIES: hypothetical protein [Bacillaceae]QHF56567.1 hypothetical protein Bateq7PJ16_0761 [Bacillus subtilis]UOG08333.1 hypothetical protein MTX65_03375 [Bacillus altitudinis]